MLKLGQVTQGLQAADDLSASTESVVPLTPTTVTQAINQRN